MTESPPTSLTSSQRFLLAILSSTPLTRPGDQEEIRWDDFLRLAGGLGVVPFVAHVVREDGLGLPGPVREQILAGGRANAMRQLRRHAALREIASSLDAAGIPLIVLKGMALAYLAYPDPYCRSMSDIDLFVPRADLGKAVELVGRLDYRGSRNFFSQDGSTFVSSDKAVQIEVHGSLPSFEDLGVDSAFLWERSLPADLDGVQVRVLRPEDCIQHLCLHTGAHHHYLSRLQGLLDLRVYLEKHGGAMQWQAVAERSVETGSSAWVYLTLWLARELLRAPVPAVFFQSCPAPARLDELSGLATRHLLSLSDLPLTSSFVRVCAGGSFKERWDVVREHWRAVGPRIHKAENPREANALGAGGYLRLFLRRMKFFVRSGALRPSAWRAAKEYRVSRTHLLNLMENQAQSPPPSSPGG